MRSFVFALGFAFVCGFVFGQDCSEINDIKSAIEAERDDENRSGKIKKLKASLKKAKENICGKLTYTDYKSLRSADELCAECQQYHKTAHKKGASYFSRYNNEKKRQEEKEKEKEDGKKEGSDECKTLSDQAKEDLKKITIEKKGADKCLHLRQSFFVDYQYEQKSCETFTNILDAAGQIINSECVPELYKVTKDNAARQFDKAITTYDTKKHKIVQVWYTIFIGIGSGYTEADALDNVDNNLGGSIAKALVSQIKTSTSKSRLNQDKVTASMTKSGIITKLKNLSLGVNVIPTYEKTGEQFKCVSGLAIRKDLYDSFKAKVIEDAEYIEQESSWDNIYERVKKKTYKE